MLYSSITFRLMFSELYNCTIRRHYEDSVNIQFTTERSERFVSEHCRKAYFIRQDTIICFTKRSLKSTTTSHHFLHISYTYCIITYLIIAETKWTLKRTFIHTPIFCLELLIEKRLNFFLDYETTFDDTTRQITIF